MDSRTRNGEPTQQDIDGPIGNWQPNCYAWTFTSGLLDPRSLHIDDDGADEVLLVERNMSRVVGLDDDGAR